MSDLLLVLDLGNSRCKWALSDGRALQRIGVEDYGPDFPAGLGGALATAAPRRAAFVSVTGAPRVAALRRWLRERWGLDARELRPAAHALGVTNGYTPPERLGADRWAALVAARARRHGALCVIDAGTAVTVDALDADGVFRGGVILPGLSLQRTALAQGTEALAALTEAEADCLARTTSAAVAGGTVYGLAGAIDRIVDEQAGALGRPLAVLITGGDAPRLVPRLRHAAEHVPELVLDGVARLAAAEAGG